MDTTAELSKSYYYKVTAKNGWGESEPSDIMGPVKVSYLKIVDDLVDSSKIFQSSGTLEYVVNKDVSKAKGIITRLKGFKNSYIIYAVPDGIDSIKIQFFQTVNQCGLDIFAADSSMNFKSLGAKLETFPPYLNYYGFFTPAVYTCAEFPEKCRYLKIKFNDEESANKLLQEIYSFCNPMQNGNSISNFSPLNSPSKMAKDMTELTSWWGDKQNNGYTDYHAKRLLLFTPNLPGWSTISDNWENVIHFPSIAGQGLNEVNYAQIIDSIANTI